MQDMTPLLLAIPVSIETLNFDLTVEGDIEFSLPYEPKKFEMVKSKYHGALLRSRCTLYTHEYVTTFILSTDQQSIANQVRAVIMNETILNPQIQTTQIKPKNNPT